MPLAMLLDAARAGIHPAVALLWGLLAPAAARAGDGPSYAVPAVESVVVNIGAWATLTTVSDLDDYDITWPEVVTTYPFRTWEYDCDRFVTNQFSHPYHGAASFTAARSAGVGFWPAMAYPLVTSLTWELFLESQAPSINDQVASSWGGVVLGESLFRVSELARGHGIPGRVGAAVLAPLAAVNRGMFPARFGGPPDSGAHLTVRTGAGAVLAGTLTEDGEADGLASRALGELSLDQWGVHGWQVDRPFDQFHLSASFASGYGGPVTNRHASQWSVRVRGLVWGDEFGQADRAGNWGLVAGHDYEEAGALRVSTEYLGLGLAGESALGDAGRLRGTAMAAWVPFGSAGAMGAAPDECDWFVGPSGQGLLDLELDLWRRARLDVGLSGIALSGPVEAARTEWLGLSQAGVALRVTGDHFLRLGGEVNQRLAREDGRADVRARATFLRATWNVVREGER